MHTNKTSKRVPEDTEQITFWIDKGAKSRVEEEAKALGMTRSAYLRLLIKKFFREGGRVL